MTLEEEKKLVIDWLGWKAEDYLHIRGVDSEHYIYDGTEWKPWEDRNCWPEIWYKLKEKVLISKYLHNIKDGYKSEGGWDLEWFFHTTSPEICWKSLIATLEQTHD